MKKQPYLIVIVGPTASGKSELAVKLAQKYNGEIISCDSRQIYRGMDIGTGKVEGGFSRRSTLDARPLYIYKSIPHYGIDITSPTRQYSVAQFQKYAQKVISNIQNRGKTPILCGGTAHWVDAVVFGQSIPEVKPNWKLRKKLEKKSLSALFAQLKKLDPARAKTIDPHNPRRLIRALEIVMTTNKPVLPLTPPSQGGENTNYDVRWFGLIPLLEKEGLGEVKVDWPKLYKKIGKRLKQRLSMGMLKEVKLLHSPPARGGVRGGGRGVSWKRLEAFGLEYKYCALYLQKKISYDDMVVQLSYAIKHYAKRQMTWFKRNKNIRWIKNYQQAQKLTKKSFVTA